MRVLRRLFRILAVLVVVLALAAGLAIGGLVTWVGTRALPQVAGRLQVPGLAAEVTVERDATGIPQIYARTPDDLFFAQGYVQASERFWQMEVFRHASAGRLSELFGKSQLDRDRLIRTLGFRQAGQRDFDNASPDTKRALQRYADGVNAWLDQNRGRLGLSFVLIGLTAGLGGGLGGYSPEPWSPVDSTSFAKLQAFVLGGNLDTEVLRTEVTSWLGGRSDAQAIMATLFLPYPADGPVVTTASGVTSAVPSPTASLAEAPAAGAPASGAPATPAAVAALAGLADLADWIGPEVGLGPASGNQGAGSNDWVVAPSKSAPGSALLANDPHLSIQMPSIWFMNGLHCQRVSSACPYDVAGVSFPGVPGVVLGHNARIAWGATNVGPDVQDLFAETVDPATPANYLYKGRSVPFTTRTETIAVAGGDPVNLTVRETVHGPVVTDVTDLKGSATPYALRWTALTEPDGILDSFLAIDRAANFQQFRDALRTYGAPSQNFVYADIDGNIGYQMPGRIPIRPAGDTGQMPVDGASGAHDWLGYIPFDKLPSMENPPAGVIVTANNAVADSTYPYFISREWDDPGWRAARIRQLLDAAAAKGGVTQADLAAIQSDTRLTRADAVIPYLLQANPRTADGLAVQQLIAGWDGFCTVESRGCSAYEVTEYRLTRAVFEPWLGTYVRGYVGSSFAKLALRSLLADPGNVLWDDPHSATVETRSTRLADALDAVGADLRGALGAPAQWAWGTLHRATFREQTIGSAGIPLISGFFDAGPYRTAGSQDTVDATWWSWSSVYPDPADPNAKEGSLLDAFAVSLLPSYRLTVDLGHLDDATIIQTTGQSGNPMDRHYGDLIASWLAGRGVPLPFSRPAVDAAAVSVLTLTP